MSESAAMAEHGPLTRTAEIQGLIDNVQPGRLFGWAWNRSTPRERLRIELRLGTEVVAQTIADSERPDLASGQIGDGRYAFDLPLTPATLERRSEISVVALSASGEELPLPIRAVRRDPAALSSVPAGGDQAGPAQDGRSLADMVRALSGGQARLRQHVEALASQMPVQGPAAAATALEELQARVETLEMRCLMADEQLAALHQRAGRPVQTSRRRLDPWQIALGLVIGIAAGGAAAWSLAGATLLLLGP
ncbi:hypothetical protein [Muricoccus vinaceus]|uniref:Uncharacterized protein n=1 Tax=Muricoccus vinaceus TaxID=424704 RepID=A0ABV6J2W3_9PROT